LFSLIFFNFCPFVVLLEVELLFLALDLLLVLISVSFLHLLVLHFINLTVLVCLLAIKLLHLLLALLEKFLIK
jgi:hypothetical protein